MSKPNKEKTWNDLTPPEVDHFFRLCANRADALGDGATTAWMEFAKYLFAANTGAAAGMFLLAKSQAQLNFAAFCLFCAGTFFVGVSFFLFGSWMNRLADGWADGFNALMRSAITLGDLDTRHRALVHSWQRRAARLGLAVSFACLMAGGILAAASLWPSQPAAILAPSIEVSK